MKKYLILFSLFAASLASQAQGLDGNVEERLKTYFEEYQNAKANIGTCKLDSFHLDHHRRKLDIYPSKTFGYQPFTPEGVEQIYGYLKKHLPGPVNYYKMTIHADGKTIYARSRTSPVCGDVSTKAMRGYETSVVRTR